MNEEAITISYPIDRLGVICCVEFYLKPEEIKPERLLSKKLDERLSRGKEELMKKFLWKKP